MPQHRDDPPLRLVGGDTPSTAPSRNAPCRCGSGRKYKHCHGGADQPASRASGASPFHDLDRHLLSRMVAYARSRFGETLVAAQDAFADAEAAFQLFMPWSLYHFLIDGRPVAEWFAADPEVRLTEAERAWLAAQRAAWLGIWEVIDVIPGQQMTMTDLLTGEQRVVVETSACAVMPSSAS